MKPLQSIVMEMFNNQKKTLQRSSDKLVREDIISMGYKPISKDTEDNPIQIFCKNDKYLYWSKSSGSYIRYSISVDDSK